MKKQHFLNILCVTALLSISACTSKQEYVPANDEGLLSIQIMGEDSTLSAEVRAALDSAPLEKKHTMQTRFGSHEYVVENDGGEYDTAKVQKAVRAVDEIVCAAVASKEWDVAKR